MSNQVIMWGMLVVPWLTLFFMKKEDIKRWMPAALFTALTSTLIIDSGVATKMWEIRQNVYPLYEMISLVYGALPVAAMWILKFTYGRFWLYVAVQLVSSFIFAYIIQPWLGRRGIWVWVNATAFKAFLPVIPHFIFIYIYQMWQEGIFYKSEKTRFSSVLQPAAAKPLPKDQENKDDNE